MLSDDAVEAAHGIKFLSKEQTPLVAWGCLDDRQRRVLHLAGRSRPLVLSAAAAAAVEAVLSSLRLQATAAPAAAGAGAT